MDLANLTQWATIATAAIALFGLVAIPVQLRVSRAVQVETVARQMYQAFLEKAVEYSSLLNVNDDEVEVISEKLWDGEATDQQLQFDWFMYYSTECFETILVAFGYRKKFWRDRVRGFVAQYVKYFDSKYFKERVAAQFLPKTKELIAEAVLNRNSILDGKL